jgi:glutathione S-transferase
MIELYEFSLSGNCHKIRLMLSLLDLKYKSRVLDGAKHEHKTDAFLTLNPLGQLPVLKDGDLIIRDSQAILVYLARQYGQDHWFPVNDTLALTEITAWFSAAANEITRGPGALRLHHKFGREIHIKEAEKISSQFLSFLNQHLTHREWLVTKKITVADIAIYPYIALAHEGNIDLSIYLGIENWLERIESLPEYVTMPGITLKDE